MLQLSIRDDDTLIAAKQGAKTVDKRFDWETIHTPLPGTVIVKVQAVSFVAQVQLRKGIRVVLKSLFGWRPGNTTILKCPSASINIYHANG